MSIAIFLALLLAACMPQDNHPIPQQLDRIEIEPYQGDELEEVEFLEMIQYQPDSKRRNEIDVRVKRVTEHATLISYENKRPGSTILSFYGFIACFDDEERLHIIDMPVRAKLSLPGIRRHSRIGGIPNFKAGGCTKTEVYLEEAEFGIYPIQN
jgi:hypothetical protein